MSVDKPGVNWSYAQVYGLCRAVPFGLSRDLTCTFITASPLDDAPTSNDEHDLNRKPMVNGRP